MSGRHPGSSPRASFAVAAAALTALSAGACGSDEAPRAPASQAGSPSAAAGPTGAFPRDTLVIATMADADVLTYVVSQSSADSNIIEQLMFGLTEANFDCELSFQPAWAKSWSFSEDHKVLSMELNEGLTWTDGHKVTPEDLAFAFELVRDPVVASPRLGGTERMVPGKSPEILDPTHIAFHFTEAYDPITMMAHVSSIPPVPKHILETADRATLRGHDQMTNPTVNGRWKIAKWDRNQSLVLEPNDKWTGPADTTPRLKRVIFRVLPEYQTRLVELEKGGVDLMESILVQDADKLRETNPNIELRTRHWRSMDYVAWNSIDPAAYKAKAQGAGVKVDLTQVQRHKLFGDPAVRRALTKAVNVQKLIDDLLTSKTGEAYARRSVGTITPALCGYHNDEIQPLPYDPSGAKAELEALGWKDSDGDGTLDHDGTPLRFSLLTNSGNARRAKAAVIIQANLKSIGIDMQIEAVESNTFFERLRKKDYDAALSGWSAGLFLDLTDMWASGSEHEFNFTSYNNPKVDELIAQALVEVDTAKQKVIYNELQRLIYEDQPYTFLYWMDEIIGIDKRFHDAEINTLSPFNHLNQWWVPEDQVKYKN